MSIDRQRPADGEVGIALHDFYREVVRVDDRLQVAPPHPCLYAYDPVLRRVTDHLIELTHIEVQAVFGGDLSTHAIAATTNTDRA
ncbi:hypothetical protein D3C73_1290420 [compost metagenome]